MDPSADDIRECVMRAAVTYSAVYRAFDSGEDTASYLQTLLAQNTELFNVATKLRPNGITYADICDELRRIGKTLDFSEYAPIECAATAFAKMRPLIRMCDASAYKKDCPMARAFDDVCFAVHSVAIIECAMAVSREKTARAHGNLHVWTEVIARIRSIFAEFFADENAANRTWPNALRAIRAIQACMVDL
jgi:hypothetical protein